MAHLGGFSEEALELFQLAAAAQVYEFSEDGEVYDFTRCMRPNGTFYGTRGKCKSGSDAGAKAPVKPTTPKGKKISEAATRHNTNKALGEMQRAAMSAGKKAKRGGGRDRALTPKEEAAVDAKIGRNRPSRVAEGAQREQMRAERAARTGGGTQPKPRATSSELRDSQRKLYDEAKAKRAAAKEAEKAAKQVEKETKGDKSKEARQRRMEAGRAWDKAATAADRAQRAWEREHTRWSRAAGRDERAKMSPAQRAEARRVDKIIKERG